MKWNSELARVFKAAKTLHYFQESLTFAALISCDVVLAFQVVQSENVLHLCVSVDDRTLTVFLTGLYLLD